MTGQEQRAWQRLKREIESIHGGFHGGRPSDCVDPLCARLRDFDHALETSP